MDPEIDVERAGRAREARDAAAGAGDDGLSICRFCLDTDSSDAMIAPCLCAGLVHVFLPTPPLHGPPILPPRWVCP